MRAESIARNYAEALFTLAEKSGMTTEYGDWLEAVAGAMAVSPRIRGVLLSPKVPKAVKTDLLTRAAGGAPPEFRHFLAAVVKRGRQALLGEMDLAYRDMLDRSLNRVRAGITLARPTSRELRDAIVRTLEERLAKDVIATFEEDPAILGGVVVRLGDRVLDGSIRRRMTRLRRQLLR